MRITLTCETCIGIISNSQKWCETRNFSQYSAEILYTYLYEIQHRFGFVADIFIMEAEINLRIHQNAKIESNISPLNCFSIENIVKNIRLGLQCVVMQSCTLNR